MSISTTVTLSDCAFSQLNLANSKIGELRKVLVTNSKSKKITYRQSCLDTLLHDDCNSKRMLTLSADDETYAPVNKQLEKKHLEETTKSRKKLKMIVQDNDETTKSRKQLFVNYDVCQVQQRAREDRFFIDTENMSEFIMMMVCDGHANPQTYDKYPHVVDEIIAMLPKMLLQNLKELPKNNFIDIQFILRKTFIEMDEHLYKIKNERDGGSTCNLVLIDKEKHLLYNANLGDSRLILCDQNKHILFESKDHDFNTDGSRIDLNRLSKKMHSVYPIMYVYSDNMSLCVSRSFGDFCFKTTQTKAYDGLHGCVSVDPTITMFDLKNHDRIKLYLTTDGPFDALSQLSSKQFIQLDNQKTQSLHESCKSLVAEITHKTNDDVTIILSDIFLQE